MKDIYVLKIRLFSNQIVLQVTNVTNRIRVLDARPEKYAYTKPRDKNADLKEEESSELGQDNERLMYGKSYVVKQTLCFLPLAFDSILRAFDCQ